jgi:hypothetical protein
MGNDIGVFIVLILAVGIIILVCTKMSKESDFDDL